MVAQATSIRDGASLETWIAGKDRSWLQVLAVRSALRVFPEISVGKVPRDHEEMLVLQVLRACSISWASVVWPNLDVSVAAASAAEAASAQQLKATAQAEQVVLGSYLAVSLAAGNDHDGATLARAASAFVAKELWTELDYDARQLASGSSAASLALSPLWSSEMPDWARADWVVLKQHLLAYSGLWQKWIKWYEDRLQGVAPDPELEVRRAAVPDRLWARGGPAVDAYLYEGSAAKTAPIDYSDTIRLKSGKLVKGRKTVKKPTKISPPKPVAAKVAPSPPPPPMPRGASGSDTSELLADAPNGQQDFLQRAPLAFVLAGRINQIWDSQLAASSPQAEAPASFVIHIDAPWGGGKTSFASYLTRILDHASHGSDGPDWLKDQPLDDDKKWPLKYRRPWFIVQFDAWRNQHNDPPWWSFYQTMRQQILQQIKEPMAGHALGPFYAPWHKGKAWLRETWWRLTTPDVVRQFRFALIVAAALWLLWVLGIAAFDSDGKLDLKTTPGVLSILVTALVGGAPAIRAIITLFTSSLVSGTPDAAKNYSLGSGDPLNRFRKHFGTVMRRCQRPILVIVDDLDRCEPKFVVELVRGMQTILKSERVIYLLLGDRDWITQSFSVVHKDMQGIEVGPEHEFGQRFVEKAIQFSFVLPEISSEERRAYTRRILGITPPPTAAVLDEAPDLKQEFEQLSSIEHSLSREAAAQSLRSKVQQRGMLSATTDRLINLELAQRSAADKTADVATRHRLEGMSHVLPPNPRQIKRIINTITYLQEVARLEVGWQPGERQWQLLARWIVLMIEWPKSWYTLSRHPALLLEVYKPNTKNPLAREIRARPSVMALLDFKRSGTDSDWEEGRITRDDAETLSQLLPPTSGEELALPKPAKPAEA